MLKRVTGVFGVLLFVAAGSGGGLFARGSRDGDSSLSGSGDSFISGSITIAGSSTVFPVTSAMAEEFSRLHPGVEIPIQSTGTGGGFRNFFIPGKTDINNASRRIRDVEVRKARQNGIDFIEIPVAIDAITVVVNPENDWVDNLTVEQLARIWRPENPALNWSDVDSSWPDEAIELYGPTSASGTFSYFTREINGEEGSSRSDYQGTEQDNTIVQAVSGSRYALGYFGLVYYLDNMSIIKSLAVEGVRPNMATIPRGEYKPLSRPIFIYVRKDALKRPEVQEFVRFYVQMTGTTLIESIGYVPLSGFEVQANLERVDEVIAGFR